MQTDQVKPGIINDVPLESVVGGKTNIPSNLHLFYLACSVLALILAVLSYQLFTLSGEQQKLAIENARLSGVAEAHSQTLAAHATQMQETERRIVATENTVATVSATVKTQGDQISAQEQRLEQQAKDIKSVQRQVKTLKETPVSNVVVAATDDAAKQEAFNNWATHHPDWKARRSCMKAEMTKKPNVTLTEAYNACG